jgi:hypothetical protein
VGPGVVAALVERMAQLANRGLVVTTLEELSSQLDVGPDIIGDVPEQIAKLVGEAVELVE